MKHLKAIITTCLIFFTTNAYAKDIKMIFWYPGEAGSTNEAQPILDEFIKQVNSKIAPDVISCRYFNTTEGGLSFIKQEKPVVGIISYAAWKQNQATLASAGVVLSTLPIPHGKSTEEYSLVGIDNKIDGKNILTSEPLSASFIHIELFSNILPNNKVTQTPQMLLKLKEIAEGKLDSLAILTPTEAATIAKLSAPWAKAIRVIYTSRPVPTARVVLFDSKWQTFEKFKTTLLTLGNDATNAEILDEMRLKGFSNP